MIAAIDLYGPAHIGILVVLIVITLLVIRNCRLGEHLPQSRASLGLLTFCCFAAYPINQMALLSCGTPNHARCHYSITPMRLSSIYLWLRAHYT